MIAKIIHFKFFTSFEPKFLTKSLKDFLKDFDPQMKKSKKSNSHVLLLLRPILNMALGDAFYGPLFHFCNYRIKFERFWKPVYFPKNHNPFFLCF